MAMSTEPRRALIFSTAYYPMIGGAEVAIREITQRLPGIEFDLICARFNAGWPRRERVGNVTLYRVGIGVPLLDKLLLPFCGAILALRLDARRRYDCYWAMMATFGSGAAFVANLLRFWRPVPVVLTFQEGDSERRLRYRWGGLIGLSWRLALRRAAMVTAISSYLAKRARSYGYRGPLEVVPNGVDAARFAADYPAPQLQAIRDRVGRKPGDTMLITTSRLVRKNAVDTVLDALALLPPTVKFAILGTGPLERDLKLKTKNLKLDGRVVFLGHIDHAELPMYLKACDIFIRPSRSEGMGNSFIEAMAAGLPVIATQEGGIADFLFDPERNPDREPTGFAVDADAPGQIAAKVEEMRRNPELVRRVVRTARELALAEYDWDRIARSMRDVLTRVIR